MSDRRSSPPAVPASRHGAPSCHGGVSSLLRMGLQTSPQRLALPTRLVAERPLFLRHRTPSTQLSLFGPAASR